MHGTLVLHDVAELTLPQQIELYDWLNARDGRAQVISVTSSLRTLVENGGFSEGLFHRLSVARGVVITQQ